MVRKPVLNYLSILKIYTASMWLKRHNFVCRQQGSMVEVSWTFRDAFLPKELEIWSGLMASSLLRNTDRYLFIIKEVKDWSQIYFNKESAIHIFNIEASVVSSIWQDCTEFKRQEENRVEVGLQNIWNVDKQTSINWKAGLD